MIVYVNVNGEQKPAVVLESIWAASDAFFYHDAIEDVLDVSIGNEEVKNAIKATSFYYLNLLRKHLSDTNQKGGAK